MTDNPTTPAHPQHDLSIDQKLALKAAADRLNSEFGDTFDAETIDRFLYTAHAHFAHHASVPNFLPLLAERFAQQQLRALARVEGKHHDGRPTVLFLCTQNAGRSQMAAAFFTELAGEGAVAWSGGSDPSDEVNPAVVQAMSERGIDISHECPKPFTDEIVQAADVVVATGGLDAGLVIPGRRYEQWTFDDPAGRDVEAVRPIRDAIEQRVHRLLAELNVPVRA